MFRFAEFVFPGHPDKLSDAIADGIVEAATKLERRALVGVEVGAHTDNVFITGRVACKDAESIDIDAIVQDVYRTAGFNNSWLPEPEALKIHNVLCQETLDTEEVGIRGIADDQSICVGYANAIAETNHLPPEHYLANRLGREIAALRTTEPDLELGPDGKIVVTLRKDGDRFELHSLSCSIQQRKNADRISLKRSLRHLVEREMANLSARTPCFHSETPDFIALNGAGEFEIGGPEGDNGLAGKKLAIDYYGPHVPIGGGALSGKDFFKVDRAGAIHARRVAKAVVMTGNVSEALVHFCWHPGNKSGEILSISSETGEEINPQLWCELFDLRLDISGENWGEGIDLIDVARYGHFTNSGLPWEQVRFAVESSDAPHLRAA